MTAFTLTSPLPAAPRVGFGRLVRIARGWTDRRATRHALRHLDGNLMRDVGLIPPAADPGIELLRKARVSW